MKKVLLFITMAAALLFTQCKKEVSVPSAGKTVSMTVTAGPGSKTDITDAGAITWSTGDKLYVGDGTQYIGYLTLVGEGGSATGVFSGNVTLPTDTKDGEKSFGFFYLGSGELTLEDGDETAEVDFSSQNIYAEDGKLQNASACHVGYGSAKGTVTDGTVTDINVMLVSKVALARFSFKKDAAAYEGALTLSGDNIYNKMTVNFNGSFTGKDGSTTDGISLGNGHGERYVMLVPTSTVADQALTFTGDNVAGPATLNDGIKPNQFYGKSAPIAVTLTPTTIPVTSVTLDKTELSLEVGAEKKLNATVYPDNATNKDVTWSSDDESVATVSDAGVVTAVAAGEATITVTAVDDDSKFATCTVTVTKPKPTFTVGMDGTTPRTVKFAPGNLYYDGAASRWKFEANQYDFRTYKSKESCINGTYSSNGTPTNDWGLFGWSTSASNNNWGMHTKPTAMSGYTDGNFKDWGRLAIGNDPVNTWHTLSMDEWDYLLNTRTNASSLREWVTLTDVGVSGLVILPDKSTTTASGVTTKDAIASSDAVFLPAAGYRKLGTIVEEVGSAGDYWSATPTDNDGIAYSVSFWSGYVNVGTGMRNMGYAVRLVRDAE